LLVFCIDKIWFFCLFFLMHLRCCTGKFCVFLNLVFMFSSTRSYLLSISNTTGLFQLFSLRFCLSWKDFISPSFLKDDFVRCIILYWHTFSSGLWIYHSICSWL
jgi:hypothetical protein